MLANPVNILYAYFEEPLKLSDPLTTPLRKSDSEYDALCTKMETLSAHMHELLDDLFNNHVPEDLKNEFDVLTMCYDDDIDEAMIEPMDYVDFEGRLNDVCLEISKVNPTLFKDIANDYEEIYFLQDDKYNEYDKYYIDDLLC